MILLGQYDSPFARRVGIALSLYQIPFEHRPWSVWGNAEDIAHFNPLRRVPTLVLDDETVLVDSFAILDAIDEMVPPERALLPRHGLVRRDGLRIAALCAGFADKAVSLLYESLFRTHPSEAWMARCRLQIQDCLVRLEAERAARPTPHWLGPALSHADIAFACSLRFVHEAHPALVDVEQLPRLAEHAARCEALPQFRAAYQPLENNL